MGDRANVVLAEESGSKIWLYSHWDGPQWAIEARDAIKAAEGRWTDEPYCHRIITTKLIGGAEGQTGYGLTTYPTDNEYNILIIEAWRDKVRVVSPVRMYDDGWEPDTVDVWSLEEFCGLPDYEIEEAITR